MRISINGVTGTGTHLKSNTRNSDSPTNQTAIFKLSRNKNLNPFFLTHSNFSILLNINPKLTFMPQYLKTC